MGEKFMKIIREGKPSKQAKKSLYSSPPQKGKKYERLKRKERKRKNGKSDRNKSVKNDKK